MILVLGENVVEYSEGDIWRKVVLAVEGETDVDEAEVEDAGVEDSTAADIVDNGLMQSDGYCGNWLQFRCFGQGRLMWGKMEIWCDGCKAVDVKGK